MARVIIEHPKTKEVYSIERSDFGKDFENPAGSYEDRGFKIITNEDGTPLSEPKRAESGKPKAD